jgi:hypothetical protein
MSAVVRTEEWPGRAETVKRDFSDATNTFAIQKTINPLDFAIAFLLNDTEWAASRIAIKLPDDAELHGRDASSNPWN